MPAPLRSSSAAPNGRPWHTAHAARVLHSPQDVPGLGPPATERAERDHHRCDRVRLGAGRGVGAVAEVHREHVAVHVVALPAGQVVLLAEVELPYENGVAHGPDAVAGPTCPDGEVDV